MFNYGLYVTHIKYIKGNNMREDILSPYLGQRRSFKGHITRVTEKEILLKDVTDLETGETVNHMWISRPHFEKKYGLRKHFKITFTAVVTEYLGLDGYKQVMKNGIYKVSRVVYHYKLRRSQR